MDDRPPPSSLLAIAARTEARIDALLAGELARWTEVDAQLSDPIASLRAFMAAGGKRLRPAFCHWAYVGAGGGDLDLVTDVGAALELLHGFALVHDDVMDGSDRRRGVPTVHRQFDERHAAEGWQGEGRRFGEGVAILVGDLAFVYADMLVAPIDPVARAVWDELRVELNIGQYLDMLGSARGDADVEAARRVATYKSAKYTIERPLHLGAAMAGRLGELEGPLTAYGIPIGEAFQLRDDLLGAFGDSEATGKPVGDDLVEGKPTPLLAVARERATGADAAVLARVGDPALDADGVAAVQEVLVSTGAAADVERRIAELTDESLRACKDLDVTAEARDALAELAAYVAWRDH
jgi:geranylgeranyl diphosphate synthase type I